MTQETSLTDTLARIPVPAFVAGRDGTISAANDLFVARFGSSTQLPEIFDIESHEELIDSWHECCDGREVFQRTITAHDNSEPFRIDAQPANSQHKHVLCCAMSLREQQKIESAAAAVLDATVDGILTIDEHGVIESINKAGLALFGYPADELIGKQISSLMPEPHRTNHQDYIDNYLRTSTAKIIGIGRELQGLRASGEVFPIYLAVSEVKDAERRYFSGIIRDLSKARAQQAQLHEQQRRLAHIGRLTTMGEMTASIAHEINQPLTAIALYAQACLKLVNANTGSTEKLADALGKLNDQALRAGAVIERIQRFVRSQEEHRELADINALVEDLTHLATGDARLHNVEITLNLDPDLPRVMCDPVQIQQVALNLIRNGIDAMDEINCQNGNRLNIETRLNDEAHVVLAVEDLGPGVPPDQADHLFTPFHTTKSDGMGMGLSICRSIISAHGGSLNFANQEPHGACFALSLPADGDVEKIG
jgi:two-component system sensor kinase FixL